MGKKFSRKHFLKYLAGLVVFPFVLLAGQAIDRHKQLAGKKIVRVPMHLNNGINFHEDIVIIKNRDDILVLSSRCTHLGCHISSEENGEMVCPCHGSRFDMNGKVIKGPANSSLKVLDFSIDEVSREIVIKA